MMTNVDLSNAQWAKSDLSSGGDNCLEVAFVGDVVALRDSKDVGKEGASVLVISREDYALYTQSVQAGQANLLP
ncbi:hypothetical protein SLA_1871 [Streptomyces laurentii]|uniref:DUF397 domain-containing protein n=1 Tax=Streptomyces laurentii TaxID=39478 RepID=A0A160NVW0_STRLU|nr:hypothetical protein SLA_1871 [Streptomyces laurentii]